MAWTMAAPALGRLRCFQAVQDPGALRALAARLEPLQLPPGFTLAEEGEEAAACWILQEGASEGSVPHCVAGRCCCCCSCFCLVDWWRRVLDSMLA